MTSHNQCRHQDTPNKGNGNNSSRNLNNSSKIGIYSNFDTGNSIMESKFYRFQNLTPPVMSRDKIRPKRMLK